MHTLSITHIIASFSCLIFLSCHHFRSPLHPFLSHPHTEQERDTSVIVISMETAQQQAWHWQPIASLLSSPSHPMAEAGDGGGHTRRSYGLSQGECSGRRDQERPLPGCTEDIILMSVEFVKLQDFWSWSHSRRLTPSIIHMRAAISIRFIKSHSIIADCDPIMGNPCAERLGRWPNSSLTFALIAFDLKM